MEHKCDVMIVNEDKSWVEKELEVIVIRRSMGTAPRTLLICIEDGIPENKYEDAKKIHDWLYACVPGGTVDELYKLLKEFYIKAGVEKET